MVPDLSLSFRNDKNFLTRLTWG